MRAFLCSSFTWSLMGGFALGAIGVAAFHPSSAATAPTQSPTAIHRSL
ncbi:hypothetical protein QH494_17355 [Sphingomonas sp. AR_OL41]|jgi:hypothetical protein|nr:hypothetical protein [Sphingomonas sp. AR_OL41]MDH7973958.1 hypothetical protein [Sphingomonas sp. AR_OL41]